MHEHKHFKFMSCFSFYFKYKECFVACMSMHYMHALCLQALEEGIQAPRAGGTDNSR